MSCPARLGPTLSLAVLLGGCATSSGPALAVRAARAPPAAVASPPAATVPPPAPAPGEAGAAAAPEAPEDRLRREAAALAQRLVNGTVLLRARGQELPERVRVWRSEGTVVIGTRVGADASERFDLLAWSVVDESAVAGVEDLARSLVGSDVWLRSRWGKLVHVSVVGAEGTAVVACREGAAGTDGAQAEETQYDLLEWELSAPPPPSRAGKVAGELALGIVGGVIKAAVSLGLVLLILVL